MSTLADLIKGKKTFDKFTDNAVTECTNDVGCNATELKQEERRERVLKMLTDSTDIQRAFVTDTESNKDSVILTMVIRDQYYFEMLIPKEKYDGFLLLELLNNRSLH